MDDAVWDHSTFNTNRDRLLLHDVIVSLFNETVETPHARDHLSGEHFNVGGTLIQTWTGQKSFVTTTHHPKAAVASARTGTARIAATTHMNQARTAKRACFVKAAAPARCFAIWAMC
ncbi:transposase [Pandoraea fibrosis]|uniref:Transposase n=1 Tax=Pandoraea fibrosis TaxID=1891094 RepID=A0A5E4WFL4_9BURK|nr:transposase [Pandoraea fibrosis]